jgi:arylsulfatase A-like enzyme
LRADYCNGEKKTSATPNIDFLIKKGVYFQQAISSIDGTVSSLGCIFTAKYPFKTNITWSKNHNRGLGFFKSIKSYGYSEYLAAPANPFFKTLSQDFEDKDLTSNVSYLGLWEGIGELILSRLADGNMQSPWIYYTHIMDLHTLKPLPEEFNIEKYGKTEYDRRISLIDNWLGKFLKKIDLSKTLVILTADHGEFVHDLSMHPEYVPTLQKFFKNGQKFTPKFLTPAGIKIFESLRTTIKKRRMAKYEKSLSVEELRTLTERGRGILFDEVLRVPLIFSGYGINEHSMITQQVRLIDILPTLESIIGTFHNQKVDGRSLLPMINGEIMDDLPVYIESIPKLDDPVGDNIGIRTSHYKYWRSRNNSKENITLFDLELDPLETTNIASEQPSLISQMEQSLLEITSDSENYVGDDHDELSEDEYVKTRNELKRLGYI